MTTLDKIKAEIEQIKPYDLPCDKRTPQNMLDMALEIIDKYAEQEPCDDAISREMALKECHDIVIDGERYRVIQEETLLGLPSVRPQELTMEEQTLLRKWRDNRGISMEEFSEALDALQEPQEGGANNG